MSTYFIGDLHIGHKAICKYRDFDTVEEHDACIFDNWNSTISKRDLVFVMGDACFTEEAMWRIHKLPGRKILVKGNHDYLKSDVLLHAFEDIEGITKYKRQFWLTHAPIHPAELRGKINIHGHVHSQTIPDNRYINVSCENVNFTPVSLEMIREYTASDKEDIFSGDWKAIKEKPEAPPIQPNSDMRVIYGGTSVYYCSDHGGIGIKEDCWTCGRKLTCRTNIHGNND